jgi:hypothetical protein
MQPLHRASVTSSASAGRSFPMESTSLSEGYPSPFSVAPPVLPQYVLGKSNPVQGGSVRPFEMAEFPKAYGPIDENLSRLSISDERSGEVSSQSEERAAYLALGMRNRENRSNSRKACERYKEYREANRPVTNPREIFYEVWTVMLLSCVFTGQATQVLRSLQLEICKDLYCRLFRHLLIVIRRFCLLPFLAITKALPFSQVLRNLLQWYPPLKRVLELIRFQDGLTCYFKC